MDTIIDANIIRRDLKLKDKGFDILVDYLDKTNSKLIFPSIVVEEIKGLYKRALAERFEDFSKSLDKLKSTVLFTEIPDMPILNIDYESIRYMEFLHKTLGTSEDNIIAYKNEYLPELVSRAIERKKPLDDKGQQFRDGLLWLTILDYAENTTEKIVAFISDNPADFCDKGSGKLCDELVKEASSRGIEIKHFRNLNDFAKEHASTIDFINQDWIEKNADFKIIEELFSEILGDQQESKLLSDLPLERNETTTGAIDRTSYIKSEIIDFFVYEKKDGLILLNIEVEFETEYEIEIEKSVQLDRSRYEYVVTRNSSSGDQERERIFIPDYALEPEYSYKNKYPLFRGTFVLTIVQKQIDKYELKGWDWG